MKGEKACSVSSNGGAPEQVKILEKKVGLFQNLHTEECGQTTGPPENKISHNLLSKCWIGHVHLWGAYYSLFAASLIFLLSFSLLKNNHLDISIDSIISHLFDMSEYPETLN